MRYALALAVCVGCYAPNAQPGAPCPDGVCPEGLTCSPATRTCELHASSDASLPDGAIDAPVDAPPAEPMLVQQATRLTPFGAMASVTLSTPPTSGNVLVMIGASASGSLTNVSGGGATWTRATSSLQGSNIEIWYGVTDGSSSIVTISRQTSMVRLWLLVTEWAGLDTESTLDAAASAAGVESPVRVEPITTMHPHDLVIFAATTQPPNTWGDPSPGSWTPLTPISGQLITQAAWYRLVTEPTTLAPEVTVTSLGWDAAIVALRAAQ